MREPTSSWQLPLVRVLAAPGSALVLVALALLVFGVVRAAQGALTASAARDLAAGALGFVAIGVRLARRTGTRAPAA